MYACIGIAMNAAVSCKTSKEAMKTTTPLFDTRWSLKKMYDNGNEEAVTTKAFIRFDQAKGSAGGNGSCNSFGTTATINGNEVRFKNIFSTKMYCEQVQQIENKYFKHLENVNRFQIKDRTLTFYNDKQWVLEFVVE